MLKQLLFLAFLVSFAFSIVAEQCPGVKNYCIQKACTDSGGELRDQGSCLKAGGFNETHYQQELDNCDISYEYCVESDGQWLKNMSCMGPISILLFVSGVSLCAACSP
ncbi:MAG: hypothetical protein ACLFUZ_04480 [Candidatus Micrarchaeia archaeon]